MQQSVTCAAAEGSGFDSSLCPGASAYYRIISYNDSYAHDDQGDNPGQEIRGLDGVLYKL